MVLLGYSLLISLIVSLFYCGLLVLIRFIRKQPLFTKNDVKPLLINTITNLVLTFVFSLFIVFLFGDITIKNGIFYLITVSILIALSNPSWIYEKTKNKAVFAEDNRIKSIRIILISALLLLETFAFNARAYKGNNDSFQIDFASSSVRVDEGDTENGQWSFEGQETSFSLVMDSQIKTAKNVRLNFVNPTSFGLKVSIGGYKETKKISEYTYSLNPVVYEHNQLGLPRGDFDTLVFTFKLDDMQRPNIGDYDHAYPSFTLSSLTFDAPVAFHYSFLRFGFFALLILAISAVPSLAKNYSSKKDVPVTRKWQFGIIVFGLVFFLFALIYVFIQSKTALSDYPLKNAVSQYDMYTQLFDAFQKGQLNIDLPYSETVKYWDHAYFNEKIYVYFGAWPVLFVSMPFYAIFQKVPTAIGLEIIGFALFVPFFFLLLTELIHLFDKKANGRTIGFLLFVSFFLSLSMSLVTYKGYWMRADNPVVEANYHVPLIYGLLHLDAFLLFTLLGYEKKSLRKYFFPLAGFSFVSIVATRPNLALVILMVCPLFITPLVKEYKEWKRNLLDYVPMFCILFIGAFLIAKYNKDRFGSYLEFGARYQYTVADMTNMGMNPSALVPGFTHYFFNPFSLNFNTHFPFVYCTNPRFTSEAKDFSTYLNGGIGLMFIPAFWGMLFNPFVHYKKEDEDIALHIFRQLFLPGIIVFVAVSYALAGLCPRYLIEPYHLATIASILGFISFARRYEKHSEILVPLFFVMILVGTFITINTNFDPFDGLCPGDLNGLTLRIREAFNDFNNLSPYFSLFH